MIHFIVSQCCIKCNDFPGLPLLTVYFLSQRYDLSLLFEQILDLQAMDIVATDYNIFFVSFNTRSMLQSRRKRQVHEETWRGSRDSLRLYKNPCDSSMENLRLYSIGKQTVVMQFVAGIVSTLSPPPRDSISAAEPARPR